jgi:hypothetical protein
MKRPHVEILYFDDCPNYEETNVLVEQVAADLRVEPEIRLVEVPDAKAALRLRFLGSPTVRIKREALLPS